MSNPFVSFWLIQSHSDPTKTYKVAQRADGTYACDCPHWKFRHPVGGCKHIHDVVAGGGEAIQVQNPDMVKLLAQLGVMCEGIDDGTIRHNPPNFDDLWNTARAIRSDLTGVEWGRLEGELLATENFWRTKYGD